MKLPAIIVLLSLSVTGCTASQHHDTLHSSNEKKMTLGLVQKEIKKGMSQADVASALGSPNMVTRDKDNTETWIYDKVSTDFSHSSSGVALGVGGAGASVGGIGGFSSGAGASSRTQRTLTVIIKFKKGLVNEYTYNASKF